MCLLDRVESWDRTSIRCASDAPADPANPLRSGGRLPAVCTVELGLQAMALHGALTAAGPQPPGFVTSLSDVELPLLHVDDAASTLTVEATLLAAERRGYLYLFKIAAHDRPVSSGRAVVMIPETSA